MHQFILASLRIFFVFNQMTYASTLSGLGVCGTGIGGLALSLVGLPIDIDLQYNILNANP
jgi:hypothetical protein